MRPSTLKFEFNNKTSSFSVEQDNMRVDSYLALIELAVSRLRLVFDDSVCNCEICKRSRYVLAKFPAAASMIDVDGPVRH